MVEKELPFKLLNLASDHFFGRASTSMTLAKVHKIKGIRVIVAKWRSLFSKGRKDGMVTDSAEPILCVRGVRFTAMAVTVPVPFFNGHLP